MARRHHHHLYAARELRRVHLRILEETGWRAMNEPTTWSSADLMMHCDLVTNVAAGSSLMTTNHNSRRYSMPEFRGGGYGTAVTGR